MELLPILAAPTVDEWTGRGLFVLGGALCLGASVVVVVVVVGA